ncbi:AraC family transcriptional regulator [Chitinophaga sp. HK235]|uniref:AraC family transcriptional regulator n=1 Tax=Chitinophaga sp. HK235 TaxID=2952571 RepID=UPI001BAD3C4A|nr:AraC family transcriptional regulator [Chitinophaga sp. HK235]
MEHLHDTFAVEIAEYEDWSERNRKNNFFELVYVLRGTGLQSVNYVKRKYAKNGIFLLPAAKCHMYIIEEPTRFLFIRFTGSYFASRGKDQIDYSSWFSHLNFILGNHDRFPGEIISDPVEKSRVKRLLDVVLSEYQRKDACSAFVIQNTLVSVLGILAHNIQKKVLQGRTFKDSRFTELINFISFNILDPEKISPAYLSDKFNISESYFSEYFQRNASERFQDFVLKTRLQIAESRAIYTSTPITEIAWELGFTDSSHLNRMMKKHFGRGMRELRKGVM